MVVEVIEAVCVTPLGSFPLLPLGREIRANASYAGQEGV